MCSDRAKISMNFELSFTNKEITPWGGMVFLKQMMDKTGFKNQIKIAVDYRNKNPTGLMYRRYFGKFTQSTNQSVGHQFFSWFFQNLHINYC